MSDQAKTTEELVRALQGDEERGPIWPLALAVAVVTGIWCAGTVGNDVSTEPLPDGTSSSLALVVAGAVGSALGAAVVCGSVVWVLFFALWLRRYPSSKYMTVLFIAWIAGTVI